MTYDKWKTTEPDPEPHHQDELDDMSREQLMYLVREADQHIAALQRLNDEERQTLEELSQLISRAANTLSHQHVHRGDFDQSITGCGVCQLIKELSEAVQ